MEDFSQELSDTMLNGMAKVPEANNTTFVEGSQPSDGRSTPELNFKEGEALCIVMPNGLVKFVS